MSRGPEPGWGSRRSRVTRNGAAVGLKWIKAGRIFPPPRQGGWLHSHAAVPFAMAIEEHRWRIFFTARDESDRSHTGWFELDPRFPDQPLSVSRQPVLEPGALGTFDDAGAMGSWLVASEDGLRLYYQGWNRGHSVPFRNAIGLAVSEDGGRSFSKHGNGPILDRGVHDPCFTANPCVLVEDGLWRMWYLSGVAWQVEEDGPQPRYHIKYAESADGISWRATGRVCIDFRDETETAISRPCVLRDGDLYRMWYSYRGPHYRIGYAESRDGLRWQRRDEAAGLEVSASGWDSEMVEYPFVFDHAGTRYMLYNGNGYGKTGIGLASLA